MEKVLGFHHEKWTVEVVLSEDTEIGRLLRSYSPELPAKVAAIIEGTFQPAALAQLVSSQLDVDRMDYLLRDSLMTGAKYGIYDLEWIINALAIDEEHDRIYVAARSGCMRLKNTCKRATTCFARSIFTARCVRRKQCCEQFCGAL